MRPRANSLTFSSPLSARDTVATDNCARWATSRIFASAILLLTAVFPAKVTCTAHCNCHSRTSCNRLHEPSSTVERLCAGNALALLGNRVEGNLMMDMRMSRRAALIGAGAVVAWLGTPARALLQAAGRIQTPPFVDDLIGRMT